MNDADPHEQTPLPRVCRSELHLSDQTNILKALYDNELGIRLLFAYMHSRRSGNVLHYRYFLESE
jgi:hypothetical protein